jgi:hypothetical protein
VLYSLTSTPAPHAGVSIDPTTGTTTYAVPAYSANFSRIQWMRPKTEDILRRMSRRCGRYVAWGGARPRGNGDVPHDRRRRLDSPVGDP